MERNLRYRKLIAFAAIAFFLLPFALCLVNNAQAETIKYIYDDVNRVLRVETGGGTATITSNAGSGGIISPSGVVGVKLGDSQTFYITPDSNYHIVDVKVDGNSVGAVTSYTFTNVAGSHTIQATFSINTNQLTVSLNNSAWGSVTSVPTGINCGTTCSKVFDYGTEVTLTAMPSTGYSFTGWSGACSGTGSCSVIADSAKSVTANFATQSFIITSSEDPVGKGTISPLGNILVYYGTNKTFTITPKIGYSRASVLVDGVSVGAVSTYTFTNVVANHTIAANFSCVNKPVRINGTTPQYFDTIQAAYDAAVNGNVIRVHALKFTENINFNRNISVTIQGGYNCGYGSVVGTTKLQGMMTVSSGKVTIKNFVMLLEATPPTTIASPSGGIYNGVQNVILTCSDGSEGTGCDKIYYTTDNTTPTTSSPVYTGAINIPVTTTLKYFAKDIAGNTEAVKTQVYTIDPQGAAGIMSINNGAANTNNINVTLGLTCADQNGCSQMQFSNDNVTWSQAEAFAATKAWTLTESNGVKVVYAKFQDTIVSWSNPYTATIWLDNIGPMTTVSVAEGIYDKPQIVTLLCNDSSGTGCDKIYYTTDNTTPTTASPVYAWAFYITQTTTLKYFATDLMGNSQAVKTTTYTITPNRVSINGTSYPSIQAAYDAAQEGAVIKAQAETFTENLNINRNISVTLDGGYSSDYTTKTGDSTVKGTIQTLPNGGTITIKNFIISN